MSVNFFIDLDEVLPPAELSIRARRRVGKAAFKAAGEYWYKEIIRQRFQPSDARRLGYQSRGAEYRQSKRRAADRRRKWFKEKGGTGQAVKGRGRVDNLLTGDFRRAVLGSTTVTPYPTRATIKTKAPNYMTSRPRGNRPWSWGEITRRTPQERSDIFSVFLAAAHAELTKRPTRKRRRIK